MKKNILKFIYNLYAFLAKIYVNKHKPIIIWVTWSVWKTSCRMIIFQVFKQFLDKKIIYTSPKNFNSELWLVFSIFKIENYKPGILSLIKIFFKLLNKVLFWKKQYDILMLEYWVDHPGDMDFLLKIAKPDYSVFTKLDYIHVENFSSKEEIWKEKIKLIENTKQKAYLNKKDEFLKKIKKELTVKSAFFNIDKSIKYNYSTEWNNIFSEVETGNSIIKTNILWEENFVYIDLALKILKNFDIDDIKEWTFINLMNQSWRFQLYKWIEKSFLIDSSYNAWPASMLKMIENTVELRDSVFKNHKIIFVIWDMRELWENTKKEHKKLYKYLESYGEIISIWKETWEYFWNHLWNFKHATDAWIFLKEVLKCSEEEYIVLFKWSQTTIYTEEALKQVLLNDKDKNSLVRQDKNWLSIKDKYKKTT